MPTTLYTTQKISSVGYDGKEYPVKDGAVDVPDNAVNVLTEAHGFTTSPAEKVEEKKPAAKAEADNNDVFDLNKLSKAELVKFNKEAELGASINNTMTAEKMVELIAPLWEAKQAEIAAAAKAEADKTAA
jgi:hypothetical protein